MQQNQKRKLGIGIALGVIISVITLVALFIIFILLVAFGGPADISEDLAEYEERLYKYDNMRTALIVFPDKIAEGVQDSDYYFYYQDTFNSPTVEVYLKCTYDEEGYEKERKRLEEIKKQYGSREAKLLQPKEGYPYPAYVAVDGDLYTYEYALLTGERQVVYIAVSFKKSSQLKKVPTEYLPTEYNQRMSSMYKGEAHNIYWSKSITFEGDVIGDSYDCTREPVAEVAEYFHVDVDYNLFGVKTCLNEKDEKIIEYCYSWHYDSERASFEELPRVTQFDDLAGYEYADIKLSEDQKTVTVSYYDGEKIKSREYDAPHK